MRDWFQLFFDGVNLFFVVYMLGYATFLFFSVAVSASTLYDAKQRNKLKNKLHNNYYIPISVIVPAHNEEISIADTIQSLLSLRYKLYEIIIVDDGSTDQTVQVVRDTVQLHSITRPIQNKIPCSTILEVFENMGQTVSITLITKENGGKSDALNTGINAAKYPYFICMDADSVLQCDSLEMLVRPLLEDNRTIAVGGAVRPSNGMKMENGKVKGYHMPRNILAAMQVLEYDRSFLASRILLDRFNGNMIISGAFGLFRKDLVIAVGGYDTATIGEDMELVMKLHVFCREHNLPYSIRYAANAICWTQVPETLRDLRKQRTRWQIGLFQSIRKHKTVFANARYGVVGLFSFVYFLLYELFSPYIEVFGVFTMLLAGYLDFLNVSFALLFFGIYVVYSCLFSLTAFWGRVHTTDLRLTLRDSLKAVSLCVFEVTFLRFFLAWIRMLALLKYQKNQKQWTKLARRKME